MGKTWNINLETPDFAIIWGIWAKYNKHNQILDRAENGTYWTFSFKWMPCLLDFMNFIIVSKPVFYDTISYPVLTFW